MKTSALVSYTGRPKNDEFITPPEAVYPILPYLPTDKIYWECTDNGNSGITRVLKENGLRVVSTGFDFLKYTPDFHFDIIITNPPFSLKDAFLERAYELGKPFAFLLPLHSLEGVRRGRLFRKYGLQLLVLDRRVRFTSEKNGPWFNVSWFCWKLLPKDLIFVSLL